MSTNVTAPDREPKWRPDPELLGILVRKAGNRLRGDRRTPPLTVLREVVKDAPRPEREQYLTAIAHELDNLEAHVPKEGHPENIAAKEHGRRVA